MAILTISLTLLGEKIEKINAVQTSPEQEGSHDKYQGCRSARMNRAA